MKERPWEISDLLALDEGRPHSAGISEDDPRVAQELAAIRRIKAQLNELPDVPLDDSVWMNVMPEEQARSPWLRYPLATAASVFLASVVGIYAMFSGLGNTGSTGSIERAPGYVVTAPIEGTGLRLAGLMRESRDLEQRLYSPNPLNLASTQTGSPAQTMPDPSGLAQTLLFRLADVDGQIARLYDAPEMDNERRQTLWTKRVDLLDSLVAVRRGTDLGVLDDTRSM
jgi:hypothetical protein